MSARTAGEIRDGHVLSTQAMFGPAQTIEREAGLNLWDDRVPAVHSVRATMIDPPGTVSAAITGRLRHPQRSVDQRVKLSGWLELFERRGGRVEYRSLDRAGLGELARRHELTIVAAGRGGLSGLFPRDPARSPYDRPQRTLSCLYLRGVAAPPDPAETHVRILRAPDVGEILFQPALTTSGPCTILLWEAVPGGPFDCWQDRPSPHDNLRRSLGLLREFAPWEHELCEKAEPTDATATLYGAVDPVVRHPVARLDDGVSLLGMGDTVVVNDPVTGQGSNSAARCADVYRRAILARGERPFDDGWMRETFEEFWAYARHATAFTTAMLGPLSPHMARVLGAATVRAEVADRFAELYADPSEARWFLDPAEADAYLDAIGAP
ncbi:styrene monooxygenase/indole monooxygenase family protein [Streptomyces hesseae]|uniref:Styrene monooxygenase/indole monooxygenase family protein n=1 Tax=Streptomyces hesseae TaxID=3075519 RepID=A0ABU2SFR9_9ACTN|nr:styrene monooxygenase/indole monooxygenase family protein [Streptomyces sp. DSM 40473]MDT0447727.1 styrene monooxygenase/indole monooxygenase family protein [Streptomyces sp. DSM 40473]